MNRLPQGSWFSCKPIDSLRSESMAAEVAARFSAFRVAYAAVNA